MPVLRRVRRHCSARRQQNYAACHPAGTECMKEYRPGPGFSSAEGTSAALRAILVVFAVSGSDLNLNHTELAADLDPLTADSSLSCAGKGGLKNQHEDGAHTRQPPEQSGAANGGYEDGTRHLLQESLAAFAADTRGNFSAVI